MTPLPLVPLYHHLLGYALPLFLIAALSGGCAPVQPTPSKQTGTAMPTLISEEAAIRRASQATNDWTWRGELTQIRADLTTIQSALSAIQAPGYRVVTKTQRHRIRFEAAQLGWSSLRIALRMLNSRRGRI